jgi:hypothetical protein
MNQLQALAMNEGQRIARRRDHLPAAKPGDSSGTRCRADLASLSYRGTFDSRLHLHHSMPVPKQLS